MSEVIALHQFRRPAARDEIPAITGAGKLTTGRAAAEPPVFFNRREFSQILNVYARMVGMGEWRDYAIGHDRDSCSFAVFRRSADGALFRIVKTPRLARKQGAFAIIGQGGRILRRGRDLGVMLRFFEPKRDVAD